MKDGTHLWAETFDRELSAANVFAVQDEITERVVGAIAGSYGVISRARFAEIKKRTPEPDDVQGVCTAYPLDEDPEVCQAVDLTGRSAGGCSLQGADTSLSALLLLLLVTASIVRRRRCRSVR